MWKIQKPSHFLKYPAEQNEKLISSGGECSAIPSTQNPAKGVKVVVYSEIGMGDELVSDSEAGSPAVNKCSGTTGSIALETPAKFLGNQNDEDMVSASFTLNEAVGIGRGYGKPAIAATIGKYGVVSSLSHTWMPQSQSQELNFNNSLACAEAREALLKGFVVKKLQKKKLHGSFELEEHEEFELEVPPGSVLLFPSDKAIDVNTFEAIGFKVKHLIVLDGTWAKAKRIYSESPWLEILPHLKLEMNKMSLYSEVRQQPKAGYLSTIESIVYALKAIGENHKGLDNLLDAFESMVGDQRRCKDERLSKLSPL
ncbi:DTW domain protein [Quillaja saponaria]|uniref:tRNA-uridine aminocarboxypropyltransferase n=1 Tax=Quillaja saponaria TaxID=32244 RepID=A0AAD7LM96_QUISA|nr:DTW domain protein [Quillaja saponaria]